MISWFYVLFCMTPEELETFTDVCDFAILHVFYVILRRKYCGRFSVVCGEWFRYMYVIWSLLLSISQFLLSSHATLWASEIIIKKSIILPYFVIYGENNIIFDIHDLLFTVFPFREPCQGPSPLQPYKVESDRFTSITQLVEVQWLNG